MKTPSIFTRLFLAFIFYTCFLAGESYAIISNPSTGVTFTGPNVGAAIGVLPGSNGGTGQPLATFPVRDYKFKADADDTLSFTRALTAAQAAPCGTVVLDAKTYQISSVIAWTGCAGFNGAGVGGQVAALAAMTPPYMRGTIVIQNTAATDIFEPNGENQYAPMNGIGMTFGESIIFSNTGNCISSVPPTCMACTGGFGYLQGLLKSTWSNMLCVGNDGNHYGFSEQNAIENKYENLKVIGGGGFFFGNYTTSDNPDVQQTGNSELHNLYSIFILSGTADGFAFFGNQSHYSGSYSNYWSGDRVQCNRASVGSINGHSLIAPGAGQVNFLTNSPNMDLSGLDLEGCTATTCFNGFSTSLGSIHFGTGGTPAVSLSRGNWPAVNGQTIIFTDIGLNTSFANRGKYDDYSTRLVSLDGAGTVSPIIMDSALQGIGYATDGTRITSVPAGLQMQAGPSGMRWSTYSPPPGTTFFDTTLNSLATYYGGSWYSGLVSGIGVALTPPSAGATSATDSFGRTGTSLGYSTGGQWWVQYTANGNVGFSTNGTFAKSTVLNFAAGNEAWLFANNYNGKVCVTFTVVGNQPELLFRLSDYSNNWFVTNTVVGNTSAGTLATLSTPITSGGIVCAVLSGTSVTITNNGSTVAGPLTSTFNQTATGYGIGVYGDTTSEFESFSVVNP